MLETVLRYGLLAGLGPGAGAALGVRPIGGDLGFSGHGVWGSLIPASTLPAPVKLFAQIGPILLGFWLVTELERGRRIGPAERVPAGSNGILFDPPALKNQLQGQLPDSWILSAGESTESTGGKARRCRVAWVIQIDAIPNIEELGSELQARAFGR